MKKKILVVLVIILVLILTFLVGTGFCKRTDVMLFDYSLAEDGEAINLGVGVSSSMGHIRGFKDNGGGVKPHYLTFYSTFGGLNSSFGTVNAFVLELGPDDTEIYFNRPGGGYELMLVKDEETGEWSRPDGTGSITTQNGNGETNQDSKAEPEKWARIPMVMVNGALYLDTGYTSTMEARCGVIDGEITSQVDGTESPTEDNQSNFGTGYGYQYGSVDGTIEVYMNEKWRIFATEEVRQQLQFPVEDAEK